MSMSRQIRMATEVAKNAPRILWAILQSKFNGGGEADVVLEWLQAVANGSNRGDPARMLEELPAPGRVRLFAWEHSYFSGKVRGYLRYKAQACGLGFDEDEASPKVIARTLVPATRSNTVPQVMLPNGRIIQDSKDIMDAVEELYPSFPVLPPQEQCPRQRLACQIIELLADEWLLVPAYHWRWAYSGDGSERQSMPTFMGGANPVPNHRNFNVAQWGVMLRPEGSPAEQRRAGKFLIDNFFLTGIGIKSGMVALGVTQETVAAWESSCRNILQLFEEHLTQHSFILGGRPSTADFALLGPIYAHLIQDEVPHEMMVADYPRVVAWCERLHGRGGACGPEEDHKDADWLPDDEVPASVMPLLAVFFAEMWPVLDSSCRVVAAYLQSGALKPEEHLPSKSFGPTIMDQYWDGPLTHEFSLPFDLQGQRGGVSHGRRMVLPYQVFRLHGLEATLHAGPTDVLLDFLAELPGASQMMQLPVLLQDCRMEKRGGLIFPIQGMLRSRL